MLAYGEFVEGFLGKFKRFAIVGDTSARKLTTAERVSELLHVTRGKHDSRVFAIFSC